MKYMNTIIVSICLVVGVVIVDTLRKRYVKKSVSAKDSVLRRRNAQKILKSYFVLFYIVLIGALYYDNSVNGKCDSIDFFRKILMITYSIWIVFKYDSRNHNLNRFIGNVSMYTKKDYLKSFNKYILYLRGFSSDQYNYAIPQKKNYNKFHELEFVGLLKKQCETCAVGLPGECDAPYGATRIYLDNETWHNDVSELMERASYIYILINDSESCIYELKESLNHLAKTKFIVDDISMYCSVKEKFNGVFDWPSFELPSKMIAIITFANNMANVNVSENSLGGYSKLLNIPYSDVKTIYNRNVYLIKFICKNICIVIFVGIFMIIVSLLLIVFEI